MSFLNELIKKKREDEDHHHPLKDKNLSIKADYLQAIAHFIVIDNKVTEGEKEKLNILIELLEMHDMKDDLYNLLENPTKESCDEVSEVMKSEEIFEYYLQEILCFKKWGTFNKKEKEFIEILPLVPQIQKNKSYKEIEIFIIEMNNKKYDKNYYFSKQIAYIEKIRTLRKKTIRITLIAALLIATVTVVGFLLNIIILIVLIFAVYLLNKEIQKDNHNSDNSTYSVVSIVILLFLFVAGEASYYLLDIDKTVIYAATLILSALASHYVIEILFSKEVSDKNIRIRSIIIMTVLMVSSLLLLSVGGYAFYNYFGLLGVVGYFVLLVIEYLLVWVAFNKNLPFKIFKKIYNDNDDTKIVYNGIRVGIVILFSVVFLLLSLFILFIYWWLGLIASVMTLLIIHLLALYVGEQYKEKIFKNIQGK